MPFKNLFTQRKTDFGALNLDEKVKSKSQNKSKHLLSRLFDKLFKSLSILFKSKRLKNICFDLFWFFLFLLNLFAYRVLSSKPTFFLLWVGYFNKLKVYGNKVYVQKRWSLKELGLGYFLLTTIRITNERMTKEITYTCVLISWLLINFF